MWLEFDQNDEQLSLIKNDIVKILAGAGTSPGDALKINLAKKTKGSNNGAKIGSKAVSAILADNNIFNRLKSISPESEMRLRQSLQRAKSDYYDLGTLLRDTFGEKGIDLKKRDVKPIPKPVLPPTPPPSPQSQQQPMQGMMPPNPNQMPQNQMPTF